MGLFGLIPWKAFTQAVPLLVDIIFNVKAGGELEQEHKDIAEIKARLKTIEADACSIYKAMRVLIVGMIVAFFIAISALVLAIVALAK